MNSEPRGSSFGDRIGLLDRFSSATVRGTDIVVRLHAASATNAEEIYTNCLNIIIADRNLSLSFSVLTAIFHVSRYQNGFIGAKDDGCDGNNCSYRLRRAKLLSSQHHQQTNTQLFIRWMPFLSPNQQCHSSEEKKYHIPRTCSPQAQWSLPTLSCL